MIKISKVHEIIFSQVVVMQGGQVAVLLLVPRKILKDVIDKTNELVKNNKNIYENNVNIWHFLKVFKGLSNNNINILIVITKLKMTY